MKTKIMDLESIHKTLKEKIYLIQKLNSVFSDAIIIIDNFDCSIVNLN